MVRRAGAALTRGSDARADCVGCRRPIGLCVCGLAPAIDNRVGVTILQHPGERRHAFNTARLARAALRNVELRVTWPEGDAGALPAGAALLWPSADAVDLAALPPSARPRHLVVLDGTWPQARTVYRDHPVLHRLPHVRLSPRAPSRYQIRREPAPHCLSTIESIAAALQLLEPETPGLDRVLDGFLAMVEHQTTRAAPRERRRKVRQRPALLERLSLDWDRLVIGYAETIGFRGAVGLATHVRWSAVRPSTGAVFQAQLLPAVDGFREQWAAFAGADVVVASWSPHATALLAEATGAAPDTLPLRAAYGNLRGGVEGHLDQVTAREGCAPVPVRLEGRPAVRLGHATALAAFLRAHHEARRRP